MIDNAVVDIINKLHASDKLNNVLNIGVGNGELTQVIKRINPKAKVIGVDPDINLRIKHELDKHYTEFETADPLQYVLSHLRQQYDLIVSIDLLQTLCKPKGLDLLNALTLMTENLIITYSEPHKLNTHLSRWAYRDFILVDEVCFHPNSSGYAVYIEPNFQQDAQPLPADQPSSGKSVQEAEKQINVDDIDPENKKSQIFTVESPGFKSSRSWIVNNNAVDKYEECYRYRPTDPRGNDMVGWDITIIDKGLYKILAWWGAGSNRCQETTYILPGDKHVKVNQRINGGRWNALDTIELEPGQHTISISCCGEPGQVVIADAIKITEISSSAS